MINLFMPIWKNSGWGICGKNLALELSNLDRINIITPSDIRPEPIGDELEYAAISRLPINSIDASNFDKNENRVMGVSIRIMNDLDLSLLMDDVLSEIVIGYTFYLGNPLTTEQKNSANQLNLIAAGSSYCENRLNAAGINNTTTIIQGINPQIFNPANNEKNLLKDRFIIFSGGKFEYRKGQDIVLKAFKIFSDIHPDALLVNSWSNFWEFSINTMAESRLIDFSFDAKEPEKSYQQLYINNDIDPKKVITLPIKPPHQLSSIFKNSDVGLFPNRCEGGTNLILMEYMACGKPAIATIRTGHADIVNPDNAFAIEKDSSVNPRHGNLSGYHGWVEPDIDEIVAHLETAYNDKEACRQKGRAAGEFLKNITWKKAALEFYEAARQFQ